LALVYKDNTNRNTSIGIWKKNESIEELLQSTLLMPFEQKEILENTKLLKRQTEKLITRRLTQELLKDFNNSTYLGISKLTTGKPLLCNSPLELSISHCEEYVTVQLTIENRAGIDIQNINPKLRTIAPRIFSKEELNQIGESDILLARAWSCKEAIYKYYEKGNINFIRDIELKKLTDCSQIYGILKTNNKVLKVSMKCIEHIPNYQVIYCHE